MKRMKNKAAAPPLPEPELEELPPPPVVVEVAPEPEPEPVDQAPAWEVLHEDVTDCTERYAVAGGWLYRSAWRHRRDIGVDPLQGSAMIFVAGEVDRG